MPKRTCIRPGDGDRRHGTCGGYTNNHCRCELCRAAMRSYSRAWAARRPPLPADDPRHGTANGYTNHGCRCYPCAFAHSATAHRRRQSGRV